MTDQTQSPPKYNEPPDRESILNPEPPIETETQAQDTAPETETEEVEEQPAEKVTQSDIEIIEDLWKQNRTLRRQLKRQQRENEEHNQPKPPETVEPPEQVSPQPPLKLSRRQKRHRRLVFHL